MSSVNREPAIRRTHPAENLPERPPSARVPAVEASQAQPQTQPPELGERFTEQHNVRIRPSTKQRLSRGVDKLRFESGDRSISIASITDAAIDEYLSTRGL